MIFLSSFLFCIFRFSLMPAAVLPVWRSRTAVGNWIGGRTCVASWVVLRTPFLSSVCSFCLFFFFCFSSFLSSLRRSELLNFLVLGHCHSWSNVSGELIYERCLSISFSIGGCRCFKIIFFSKNQFQTCQLARFSLFISWLSEIMFSMCVFTFSLRIY